MALTHTTWSRRLRIAICVAVRCLFEELLCCCSGLAWARVGGKGMGVDMLTKPWCYNNTVDSKRGIAEGRFKEIK
ncbi:hypothetical protein BKA65DRAFT_499937 [Rhexocercosporidium sp. MPI-PUGE-AT-0058]|nr:hypothetical protein BKA65DRAFT_499937 [Rhexocercosporidium sp. MPI-PUGE-AT-0058]